MESGSQRCEVIFIYILRIISLLMWMVLSIYAIVTLRECNLVEKKTGVRSTTKKSVLYLTMSCLLFALSWLVSCLVDFQMISLGQNRGFIDLATISIAIGLFSFSVLTFTGIIISSLALAGGGVQGARDKVLTTVLRSIKFVVIVPIIAIILVGLISPGLPFIIAGVFFLIGGAGYALLSYKANIVSMEETTKLQGITETCKIMRRVACIITVVIVSTALIQFAKAPFISLGEKESTLFYYIEWLQTPIFGFTAFTVLNFLSSTIKKSFLCVNGHNIDNNRVAHSDLSSQRSFQRKKPRSYLRVKQSHLTINSGDSNSVTLPDLSSDRQAKRNLAFSITLANSMGRFAKSLRNFSSQRSLSCDDSSDDSADNISLSDDYDRKIEKNMFTKSLRKLILQEKIFDEFSSSDDSISSDDNDNGIPIVGTKNNVIGKAPAAPRPKWLPSDGPGQANVPPERWSISIANWAKFILACIHTDTWEVLAKVKGEKNINMHDITTHFVKPWTRGTGCSIAMLLDQNQSEIEAMVSHSCSGSVKESFCSVLSLVSLFFLPNDAKIFFCVVCLYQCGDGADGGLTIPEQLDMKPFAKIIDMKPKYGMFIIHTTTAEVLDRLWCVHEVDEALLAQIKIYGIFDPHSWSEEEFNKLVDNIDTKSADCQGKDRKMLTELIEARGGFARLDEKVKIVRMEAKKDMLAAHLFQQIFSIDVLSLDRLSN